MSWLTVFGSFVVPVLLLSLLLAGRSLPRTPRCGAAQLHGLAGRSAGPAGGKAEQVTPPAEAA